MSKLTATGDQIIKEIEHQSGVKLTFGQSKFGEPVFTKSDGKNLTLKMDEWMRYQNSFSGMSVETHEFMDMNLLLVDYIMIRMNLEKKK